MTGRRAAFVDRDGVLIRAVHHLRYASQIEILPGVPESLGRLRDAGWAVVAVTNQSAVARGLLTEDGLREIHRVLEAQLESRGAALDAIYYCPHHPEGAVAAYRVVCDCRKPQPGLLLQAAADLGIDLGASVMVGDAASDVETGRRAGCRTVLIRSGEGPAGVGDARETGQPSAADRGAAGVSADHVAVDLPSAVDWMLSSG